MDRNFKISRNKNFEINEISFLGETKISKINEISFHGETENQFCVYENQSKTRKNIVFCMQIKNQRFYKKTNKNKRKTNRSVLVTYFSKVSDAYWEALVTYCKRSIDVLVSFLTDLKHMSLRICNTLHKE